MHIDKGDVIKGPFPLETGLLVILKRYRDALFVDPKFLKGICGLQN